MDPFPGKGSSGEGTTADLSITKRRRGRGDGCTCVGTTNTWEKDEASRNRKEGGGEGGEEGLVLQMPAVPPTPDRGQR